MRLRSVILATDTQLQAPGPFRPSSIRSETSLDPILFSTQLMPGENIPDDNYDTQLSLERT